MKKVILIVLFTIAGYTLKAQNEPSNQIAVSLGPELAIPAQSIYNIGYGASIKAEFPIYTPFTISLTAGYTRLHYRAAFAGSPQKPDPSTFVPLKAGIKYYVSKGFYGEAEAGTAIETNYSKQNRFAWSIGPGFVFPAGPGAIDFGLRYERWENQLRQTGIRVAYRFGW